MSPPRASTPKAAAVALALSAAAAVVAPAARAGEWGGRPWDLLPFCDLCRDGRDVVVDTNVVDPAALPEGAIPPAFSDADLKTESLQGAAAIMRAASAARSPSITHASTRPSRTTPQQIEGFELHAKKAELERFLRKPGDDSISVTLKPASASGWAIWVTNGLGWNPQTAPSELSLDCGTTLTPLPLRWERFNWDADGKAGTVEIDDGWFDRKTCSSHLERASRAHVAVVVRHAGRPALGGLRDGESVLLVPVPGVVATPLMIADTGAKSDGDGVLRLPLGGGRAASASFTVVPLPVEAKSKAEGTKSSSSQNVQRAQDAQQAVQLVAMPAAPPAAPPAPDDVHAIIVQVSQSVAETSATMLVQLATNTLRPIRRHPMSKMMVRRFD